MLFVRRLRDWALCLMVLYSVVVVVVYATPPHGIVTLTENEAVKVESLSLEQIQKELETCPIVQQLNAAASVAARQKNMSFTTTTSTSWRRRLLLLLPSTSRIFSLLFPGSPATNALLATLYISGPPNLLLALCPTDIDPSSLSVMVAFAVGGLLGDTLFHLLPEIFLGEGDDADAAVVDGVVVGWDMADAAPRARFVLVEPNRNLLLGLAILVGFMVFVAMDKGMRIATAGGGGGGHGHGHSHGLGMEQQAQDQDELGHGTTTRKMTAEATGVDATSGTPVKSRKGNMTSSSSSSKNTVATTTEKAVVVHDNGKEMKPSSVKLGGYLNLIADFTHNVTDGLAMSASFYASPAVGATTTVAVFFHEIPHEVGDFALLVQSGFSKRAAMASQFVTALGALLGTLIGIAVHELGHDGRGQQETTMPRNAGIWGTSLTWGDLLLPFTAGTFLYVGTVAVIPDLLETDPVPSPANAASGGGGVKMRELRKTLTQFAAVALGAGIMLYISWHD